MNNIIFRNQQQTLGKWGTKQNGCVGYTSADYKQYGIYRNSSYQPIHYKLEDFFKLYDGCELCNYDIKPIYESKVYVYVNDCNDIYFNIGSYYPDVVQVQFKLYENNIEVYNTTIYVYNNIDPQIRQYGIPRYNLYI